MTRNWAINKKTGGRLRLLPLLLAACLLLGGCSALLERSYNVTEPYSNRYWDSGAEDTLRAESRQDLVTSMLMLIEQRAEEGVIRCYGEANAYKEAAAARDEVRRETVLGTYLLRDLRFSYENGASYSTVACHITYREDAEDVASLMSLTDTQSLVDLLRLAVREEHEKLTARFAYDTPKEDVEAAVESLWQELCRASMEEAAAALEEADPDEETAPVSPEGSEETPPEEPEAEPAPQEEPEAEGELPPEEPDYPPCPWLVRFYPNRATAEIVEILLQRG